jgi:hypothetical protein
MRLLRFPLLPFVLAVVALPACAQNPLAHDPTAQDTTTTDANSGAPSMTPEQIALIDRYLTPVQAEPVGKVDTRNAAAGQGITLQVTADATLANGTHLPKGTQLTGRILRAQAWQQGGAAALLSIRIDRAMLKDGSALPIRCVIRMVTHPAGPAVNLADASQPGSRRRGSTGPAVGGPVGGAIPLGNPTPMGGPIGTDTGGIGGIGGADSSANTTINPNSTNPRSAPTIGGGMPAGDPGIGGSGTTGTDRTRAALGSSAPVPLADPELPVTLAGESIHDAPRRTGIPGVMLSGASVAGVSGTLSAYETNITLDPATQLTLGIISAK